ncbi:MAG: hypothetical protein C0594_06410 [Marinilabiliales bacterium]|nr:MAG: hypothetical protein C0594_06410 [Marinilabiliales bacterium]
MKYLTVFLIGLFMLSAFSSCDAQQNKKVENSVSDKVEVYYFHYTRRCATCNAVEDETKKALEKYYADELKSGKVTFTSVNLDEAEGEKIGEKIGVSGQALIIVKGSDKTDLTNEGFMFARSTPTKLYSLVKEAIGKISE